MANMFDYLQWRGDILFSQLPLNRVDMLIFSALSYIHFDNIVPEDAPESITLSNAAEMFDALPDKKELYRISDDALLLSAAASSPRFANIRLTAYKDIFIPSEDTQFSAITFLPDKNTVCSVFRGTDNTLVGWKEDFNMTFSNSVPSQRLAAEYVETISQNYGGNIILGGHSKGGNLAVYAAANCNDQTRIKISAVYNFDGPGFNELLLSNEGYRAIVPRIYTFVPQGSVFGMLLERQEPHTIIKSNSISLLQHDPYSWEIMGANFLVEEQLSPDARFLDRTFHSWISGMTVAQRNEFFDSLFELLMTENAQKPIDILKPQNIKSYLKSLKSDENKRRIISAEFISLAQSAMNAQKSATDTEE